MSECKKPMVALGMPRRGHWAAFGASQGFHLWPSMGDVVVIRMDTACSLLDHTFNRLWTAALNLRPRGVDYFAMLHDDISPMQGWLDRLYGEMRRTGANVLSAVIPIKGEEGTTSTAVEGTDIWTPRRLTMTEAHALPVTFGDEEVGGELLLNSGCWIADIRQPFADQPHPLTFQTQNRIIKDENGEWQAQVRSEDWEFSRAARARGAKLMATRIVQANHVGEIMYPNDRAWGTWTTDKLFEEREKKSANQVPEGREVPPVPRRRRQLARSEAQGAER